MPTTPEPIFKIASGFMAAKHLFAAAELGLFEAVGEDGATLDELTERLGIPRRSARISADAMVALGLVQRDGERYVNGPAAATFLAGAPGPDLRPMARFWDQLSYRNWLALADTLRTGHHPELALTEADQQVFTAGVDAVTAGPAHALAAGYDWTRHRRALDVGGGNGSFLLAAREHAPDLAGTVVEIPEVAALAREHLAGTPIDVVAADALTDPLPEGHDVMLVANFAHLLSPESNRLLLERLRAVAPDGGRLLLADFWTDPTHADPVFAALMAGEFMLFSDGGDVYSVDEVHDWLAATGWRALDHRPLAGPQSLIVAEVA